MKKHNKTPNSRGFSLIEVMTASVIGFIMMYALIALITNAVQVQRGVQAKDIQRELMGELRVLLNETQACVNTLGSTNGGGNPTTGYDITIIRDSANRPVYTVNETDPSGRIRYARFNLEGWVPNATIPNKGHAYLRITLEKTGQVVGARTITQRLAIQMTLDGSNKILSCSYFGGLDSLWKQSPVNSVNIYYTGGNVAIGRQEAREALDVAGNVLATAYFWTSDARKKILHTPAPGLDHLRQITGYEFSWKENKKLDLGVVAQDIEKVFPQLVKEDTRKIKHVNYAGLIAPLIESTKELDQHQQTLLRRIEELEKEMREMKARCKK